MSAYQLQIGVFNKLNAATTVTNLVVGIYDNPAQVDSPESAASYPYITVGQADISPWDTDTESGFDALVTVHTWSRKSHHLECKQVQDAIYGALHRQAITITGWHFVGCDLVGQDAQRDPDGITIHGVQTFKIIFEEL